MSDSALFRNLRLSTYLFIGNLLAISVGLHNIWPYRIMNRDHPNYDSRVHLTQKNINIMYLCFTAGCVIGGFLTILGKRYLKQKRTFLIISVIYYISAIIHAFSKSYGLFCVARFITGLAIGSTYVMLPSYFAEISPKSEKAAHMSTIFVFVQIGEILGVTIIQEYLEENMLKVYSVVCLAPPCLFFFLFALFVPESPVQLVVQNRYSEAQKEIKKLRGTTFAIEEYEEIVEVQNASYQSLISNRALHILFGLATLQQMTGLGFFNNTVSTYNVEIIVNTIGTFKNGGYLLQLYKILGTIIGMVVLYQAGLKFSLTVSAGVMLVINLFLIFYFDLDDYNWTTDYALLAAFNLLIIFYNIGVGPVLWLLIGESFPPKMKSLAAAMISMCPFIVAFAYYMIIIEYELRFDTSLTFGIGAAFSAIILFFAVFWIPDTKYKSTLEIQNMFNKK